MSSANELASENNPDRFRGTVKWFDAKKGFGFVSNESLGDVFCHFSTIRKNGFKKLYEGDRVRFEVEESDKGLRTLKVWKLRKRNRRQTRDVVENQTTKGESENV
jgi:CspA family cold shock protein